MDDPDLIDSLKRIHPGNMFDYQLKWAEDTSNYKLAVKARQIGITTTEACLDFLNCLLWEECEEEPHPPVIVFCSPAQRQSNRLMQYVQRAKSRFEKVFHEKLMFKKEREDFILFNNHAELWSLPNNPRTIEGIDASRGVIDEFGNFVRQEDKQVYESLMGSLGAKGGGLTIFGKPRGRAGMFWKLYDPYGEFSSQYSIHHFTYEVRAKQDPKYRETVEAQRKLMSSLAFEENYMCKFVDESTLIFPYELLDNATQDYPLWTDDSKIDTLESIHFGIDFGKKTSQTVVTMVVKDGDKLRVKYIKAIQKDFEYQINWIGHLIDKFKPYKVRIDKTGIGQSLHEQLVNRYGEHTIIGVQFTSQTKEKLIYNTLRLFEENKIILPDHPVLKDQLHGIEKEYTAAGTAKYTGKRTETDWMDDHAWSLFLALFEIEEFEWNIKLLDSTPPVKAIDPWGFDDDDD